MKAALLATASTLLLAGGPTEALSLRTTLRGETLRLPQDEALGLLGLSSTVDFGPWYLGPGLYGAARGTRGGFFTFGLEGGLRSRPWSSLALQLDAGLFLGGGGGASAPQGGGLMLRPHLGASILLGPARLGAELSRVHFPNGGIDSTQAALTLAFASARLWVPEGFSGQGYQGTVTWEDRGLELGLHRVDPAASARTRSGAAQKPLDLAGLALTRELGGPWFRFLSADGAAGGSSSGYAQALAGLGLRASLPARFGLQARLGAGLGGGGDLDTGGGLLLSGEGALTLGAGSWRAAMGLGFLRAPSGRFDGRTTFLRFSHRVTVPVPQVDGAAPVAFDRADWRMGSGVQVYGHAQRQDGTEGPIQLMTLRADRRLGRGFYLTGEAGSATGGGAGGYSTGLAGLGCETSTWSRQQLFLETALGASGGGGLRTGGGGLASLRTGWRLELPHGLGLEASAGQVRAPRGNLVTATYGIGMHLRFQSLER